ncbi:hypothetical protein NMY22_g15690 [Coprinellus aureogranulatus]|nr:hypothetical protein NMY22_g15690 [Coprinellus aureogranulatus]
MHRRRQREGREERERRCGSALAGMTTTDLTNKTEKTSTRSSYDGLTHHRGRKKKVVVLCGFEIDSKSIRTTTATTSPVHPFQGLLPQPTRPSFCPILSPYLLPCPSLPSFVVTVLGNGEPERRKCSTDPSTIDETTNLSSAPNRRALPDQEKEKSLLVGLHALVTSKRYRDKWRVEPDDKPAKEQEKSGWQRVPHGQQQFVEKEGNRGKITLDVNGLRKAGASLQACCQPVIVGFYMFYEIDAIGSPFALVAILRPKEAPQAQSSHSHPPRSLSSAGFPLFTLSSCTSSTPSSDRSHSRSLYPTTPSVLLSPDLLDLIVRKEPISINKGLGLYTAVVSSNVQPWLSSPGARRRCRQEDVSSEVVTKPQGSKSADKAKEKGKEKPKEKAKEKEKERGSRNDMPVFCVNPGT